MNKTEKSSFNSFLGRLVLVTVILTITITVIVPWLQSQKAKIANAEQATSPADIGWVTIADKPVWNDGADIWQVPVFHGIIDGQQRITIAYGNSRKINALQNMIKGDKVFIVRSKISGDSAPLIVNVSTSGEYDKMVNDGTIK